MTLAASQDEAEQAAEREGEERAADDDPRVGKVLCLGGSGTGRTPRRLLRRSTSRPRYARRVSRPSRDIPSSGPPSALAIVVAPQGFSASGAASTGASPPPWRPRRSVSGRASCNSSAGIQRGRLLAQAASQPPPAQTEAAVQVDHQRHARSQAGVDRRQRAGHQRRQRQARQAPRQLRGDEMRQHFAAAPRGGRCTRRPACLRSASRMASFSTSRRLLVRIDQLVGRGERLLVVGPQHAAARRRADAMFSQVTAWAGLAGSSSGAAVLREDRRRVGPSTLTTHAGRIARGCCLIEGEQARARIYSHAATSSDRPSVPAQTPRCGRR